MRNVFLVGFSALFAACSSSNSAAPPSSGDASTAADSSVADAGTAEAGPTCTAALDGLLHPQGVASSAVVSVVSDSGGTKTIYVDASAGGASLAPSKPWVYVSFAQGARVDLSDVAARTSTAWDLALKRADLFTNDGDAGPGQGGAVLVNKDFDAVTSADATGAVFATEAFVDGDCNPQTDATGAVVTTFSGWYDYNEQAHTLTAHPGTYLVKSATGSVYKVAIANYYAAPDGGTIGQTPDDGAHYTLKVAPL